jgi:hypothetical protein
MAKINIAVFLALNAGIFRFMKNMGRYPPPTLPIVEIR